MKRILSLLLALLLLPLATLATLAEDDPPYITVNGEIIRYSEYYAIESAYMLQYESMGMNLADDYVYAYVQDLAVTHVVEQRLLEQDMAAQGCYAFTEEEEAWFAEMGKAAWTTAMDDVRASILASDATLTADELEVYALAYAASLNVTEQTYTDFYRTQYAQAKYYDWLTRDNPVTDEDVQADYQARVEESRMLYATDAASFEHAMIGSNGAWYFPEGYRTVQQILLPAEGETEAEKLASVQGSVDGIYARLEKGDAFADLVAEYSADPNPSGYQVHRDSVVWDDAFTAAAFADDMTQPGCWSQPLVSDMGVHILFYVEDVASGAVPLTDELAEALRTVIYTERSTAALKTRVDELATAAEVIFH